MPVASSRRLHLKRVVSLLALGSVAAARSALSGVTELDGGQKNLSPHAEFDTRFFLESYRCWNDQCCQAPASFLAQQLRKTPDRSLADSVAQDFISGDIVDVDGFILAKTEASVLAYMGSLFSVTSHSKRSGE